MTRQVPVGWEVAAGRRIFSAVSFRIRIFVQEPLIRSSPRFAGSFAAVPRLQKLEIYRSRWRRRRLTDTGMPLAGTQSIPALLNFALRQNLSPNQAAA